MKIEKTCDHCGKKYIAGSKRSKYCSNAHRIRAHEQRTGKETPNFIKKQPSVKKSVYKPLQTVKTQKTDSAIGVNQFASNTLLKLQNDRKYYVDTFNQVEQNIIPYTTVGGLLLASMLFGKEDRTVGVIAGGIAGYAIGKKLQTNREFEINKIRLQCIEKVKEIDKQISILQTTELKQTNKADANMKSELQMYGGKDVINQDIPTYKFSEPYSDFIGHPTENFSAIVYGLPKSGKSNFSIQFASYLARQFGKVLYVASEEGLRSQTLIDKVKYNLADNREIMFSGERDIENVKKQINQMDFKFIFFDSLNALHITSDQLQEVKKQFPDKAFISVLQSTKDGAFKGSQEFAHNCDVIIKVDSGIASQTGRFSAPSQLRIFK